MPSNAAAIFAALVLLAGCGQVVTNDDKVLDDSIQLASELKGPKCGNSNCPSGKVCCNSSCGICTEPGGFCTQQYCEPTGNTCTVIALCIQGYSWSSAKCACVRNSNPGGKPGSCTVDADCRLYSDYCTGCDCRSLSTNQKDPTCSGPGVRCFADPCGAKAATCVNNSCVVSDAVVQ